MIIMIVCVAYGTATLVDVLVWTQMIVVGRVNAVVSVTNVVNVYVRADVALADLVQDGPGALGVDGGDLSHDLSVVVVGVVVVLASCCLLFRRANFLCTCTLRTMSMIPVLTLVRLVRRATALSCLKALEAVLLVIVHSTSPQHVS